MKALSTLATGFAIALALLSGCATRTDSVAVAMPARNAVDPSPGRPTMNTVIAETTVSPMQSSAGQAAEWSNHGARAARSL